MPFWTEKEAISLSRELRRMSRQVGRPFAPDRERLGMLGFDGRAIARIMAAVGAGGARNVTAPSRQARRR